MLLMATTLVILQTNIIFPISFCNINALKLNVHKLIVNDISEEYQICANRSKQMY